LGKGREGTGDGDSFAGLVGDEEGEGDDELVRKKAASLLGDAGDNFFEGDLIGEGGAPLVKLISMSIL
jgi:hypothetical protein